MRKLATMVLVLALALGLPLATNAKGKQSKSKPAHKSQRAPDEHKAFEQQKKQLAALRSPKPGTEAWDRQHAGLMRGSESPGTVRDAVIGSRD